MEKAKLTFLGTGTSQGVPIIGCQCEVCRSSDARDKRFRAAALIEYGGLSILVDAGPDFRSQMLAAGVRHLDAILLTHNHKDHTGGLDDVRALNYIDKCAAEIYCEERVLRSLKVEYSYAFAEDKYPGAPEWHIHTIGDSPFTIRKERYGELTWMHDVGYGYMQPDGTFVKSKGTTVEPAPVPGDTPGTDEVTIIPIRGYHDTMPVLGFRFGDIAYITDMSSIPDEEFSKLKGLRHLTLNTVGYKRHHSHFSLEEAEAIAARVGAEHTWLTHLSHTFPRHEEFCGILPDGILPAYDGLTIE